MPRKKATDVLAHLDPGERADVLSELLKRHPDLRREANAVAVNLINDVSIKAIAEEVVDLVTGIDLEELYSRAGKHSWGYVEPSEAAWGLLEESIEDMRADMLRRFEAGMKPAAEKICQGIILGLHKVEDTSNNGLLGQAPDFPAKPRPGVLRFYSRCIHCARGARPETGSSRPSRRVQRTGSRC